MEQARLKRAEKAPFTVKREFAAKARPVCFSFPETVYVCRKLHQQATFTSGPKNGMI